MINSNKYYKELKSHQKDIKHTLNVNLPFTKRVEVLYRTNNSCEDAVLPSGLTLEKLIELRSLTRKYEDIQKARKAFMSRIRSMKEGLSTEGRIGKAMEEQVVKGVRLDILSKSTSEVKAVGAEHWEKQLVKLMKPIVYSHRLWVEWFSRVKGIGELLAAKIIGNLEPYWAQLRVPRIQKGGKVSYHKLFPPRHRSSLNKLCGYGLDDTTGRAERKRKGTKLSGNPNLKALFWNVHKSLMKQKGRYYETVYLPNRKYYEAYYPKYLKKYYKATTRSKARAKNPHVYIPTVDELAQRKSIKVFISILWEAFQELYGLKIHRPMHGPNKPLMDEEWIRPEDLCEPSITYKIECEPQGLYQARNVCEPDTEREANEHGYRVRL